MRAPLNTSTYVNECFMLIIYYHILKLLGHSMLMFGPLLSLSTYSLMSLVDKSYEKVFPV